MLKLREKYSKYLALLISTESTEFIAIGDLDPQRGDFRGRTNCT